MAESPSRRTPIRGPRVLRRRRLTLLAVVVLLLVTGVGMGIAASADDGAAPAEVRLDGADISGMDAGEVAAAARARAEALMDVPMVITRDDDPSLRVEVTRRSLAGRPQIRRAVSQALEQRSFGGRLVSLIGLAPERDVRLAFTFDQRKVSALVARVRRPRDRPARPAGLEVGPDDITVVPGTAGRGIDAGELRDRVREFPDQIALAPVELPPPVSDAAAESARARALALVARPVSVTFQGRGVPIEPTVLRTALRISPAHPTSRSPWTPTLSTTTSHRRSRPGSSPPATRPSACPDHR